jgi:hypothetical protein
MMAIFLVSMSSLLSGQKKQRRVFFRTDGADFVYFDYFFFMKKVNSPPASAVDSSSLPVCLAKAAKSLTEPGSVERIFSTWPLVDFGQGLLGTQDGQRAVEATGIKLFIEIHLCSPYIKSACAKKRCGTLNQKPGHCNRNCCACKIRGDSVYGLNKED